MVNAGREETAVTTTAVVVFFYSAGVFQGAATNKERITDKKIIRRKKRAQHFGQKEVKKKPHKRWPLSFPSSFFLILFVLFERESAPWRCLHRRQNTKSVFSTSTTLKGFSLRCTTNRPTDRPTDTGHSSRTPLPNKAIMALIELSKSRKERNRWGEWRD